jgi:tetratricopeptide (TPR) repeat protein
MGVVFAARDPVLDRKVAIKLIQPGKGSSGGIEARLLREAQALARLTHPNVVTVHEAGVVGGTVFLAMELVDGVTLRDWMATARPWRDIVEVFVAAGTGLAAAHAAGMIHRDFTPANVLIDHAGRVKVGDFGLVGVARDRTTGAVDTPAPPSPGSVLASPLTQDGAVMGTPAYMAPEQLASADVDARADQYAFCKSLGEALATATDTVPPGLTAITVRGQLADAGARYPTMAAVLAAIDGVVRGRRRRVVGAAVGGGVVAAAAVAVIATWGVVGGGGGDPCAGTDPTAAIWSPARRDAVRAHLVQLDPASGAARFATVTAALDDESGRLATMRHDACRANRVTRAESDTLYDRRIECLDHRGTELGAAVDALLATKDLSGVDAATTAAQNLSADVCADGNALLAQVPPPADPAKRKAIESIQAELAVVAALRMAGKLDGQDANTAAIVERARATGYDPILSAALRIRAEVLGDTNTYLAEADVLHELTDVAARAHDDASAAWAWGELLHVLVEGLKHRDEAAALIPAARAALLRAGATPTMKVDFLYNLAKVYSRLGQFDDAQAQANDAIAILTAQGAEQPGSREMHRLADVVLMQGNLFNLVGNTAEAEKAFRRAIDLYTRSLGADHADTAWGWHALGVVLQMEGKADDAIAAYREAVKIREARTGDSPVLADTLVPLAQALSDVKQYDASIEQLKRAVAIYQAHGTGNQVAYAQETLGSQYANQGRVAEAHAAYDAAIATFEQLGADDVKFGIALVNRAEFALDRDELDIAEPDFTRALAVFIKLVGPDYPYDIYPLVGLADVALLRGKRADAIGFADRALKIDPKWKEGNEQQLELARFIRAAAKGDRAGMKASRAALAALGPVANSELELADKWLNKH